MFSTVSALPVSRIFIVTNLLFVNDGLRVNPTPAPLFGYMFTHARPSGESLTNYVAVLSVEVGQP